ncbi:MAG: peptide chain release factor 2 [Candidatus Margulisiibacteriota bacterium]|nr:peptide chain release factor 2 [Candidatus Margulisiibacteriota bacterium]
MLLDEIRSEINTLKQKGDELGSILKIENKKKELGKLDQEASDPKLWENGERAKKLLQDKKILERELNSFEELKNGVEDLSTLIEMAKDEDLKEMEIELQELKKKASKLELAALLGGPYDKNNAILSINAGAGGTDAQDWAQILLRMYTRWSEARDYKVEMPEVSYGDEAGLKSVTLMISGPYAFGYLKNESGIHRLVRISPFSSEGKRHTSFTAVEVIPEITEDVDVDIDPSDLRIDTYRASGPGGQHVNKTDSAIRITHIPTGIVAQSQSDRSQHLNRDSAMRILKARLYEMMLEQRKEKIEELRGEKKKIEWGSQIRSYVFHPYTMVKDHRYGVDVGNVQRVIDGDLDEFIEAALRRGK